MALGSYTLGREGGREDWAVVKVAQPWGSSGAGRTLQKHPKWRQRAFGPPASICRWIEAAPWEGVKAGMRQFPSDLCPNPTSQHPTLSKSEGEVQPPSTVTLSPGDGEVLPYCQLRSAFLGLCFSTLPNLLTPSRQKIR